VALFQFDAGDRIIARLAATFLAGFCGLRGDIIGLEGFPWHDPS